MTNYSSNLETVHAWANSLNNDGNNSNHSINFRGNVVYSYSTPMAEFIAGSNVVLFNTEKYSVTTSSHQSIIRGAIPYSVEIIEVPFGSRGCNNSLSHSSDHSSNFEAWENKLVYFYGKIKKAKAKKEDYLQQANLFKLKFKNITISFHLKLIKEPFRSILRIFLIINFLVMIWRKLKKKEKKLEISKSNEKRQKNRRESKKKLLISFLVKLI